MSQLQKVACCLSGCCYLIFLGSPITSQTEKQVSYRRSGVRRVSWHSTVSFLIQNMWVSLHHSPCGFLHVVLYLLLLTLRSFTVWLVGPRSDGKSLEMSAPPLFYPESIWIHCLFSNFQFILMTVYADDKNKNKNKSHKIPWHFKFYEWHKEEQFQTYTKISPYDGFQYIQSFAVPGQWVA